ncbi:unnamed protein product [Anisakis simplex]|uniref:C2H2-type domain-containing protein n=1 Tax=Anisakis simplex TaxID=6269 RepID=A0A0M3K4J4_ANISI|nr:unnamed protein product [Anisakis simplex]
MWGCHFSALKRQKALIGRYNSNIGFIPSTHLNLPLIRPLLKELCYYCSFGPKTCAATHARTRAIASRARAEDHTLADVSKLWGSGTSLSPGPHNFDTSGLGIGSLMHIPANIPGTSNEKGQVNYNVDYISNAAYEKATEELNNQMGNGRKRKKNQSASSPKSLTQQPRKKQCNSNDSNSSSLALKPKYPWDSWNFDSLFGYARVAANASRKSNARNYNFDEKLPVACGGFRLLVRICPDAFIKSFRSRINEDEVVRGETDDETTFDVQLLRHAWNRLSESERLRWEMEARKEVKEAEKVAGCERGLCPEKPDQNDASIRHRTDDVNEVEGAVRDITGEVKQGSEQCNMDVMDSVSKDDEPVADGSHAVKTSMPSCEIRFHSSRAISDSEAYNKLNFGVFRCHLCPQKVTLAGADAFQLHLIQNHHSARFYACHLCFEAFSSLEFLKKHPCQEFASYTVGLLTANKQFAMKFVMHTLVCAECNLQMPLPANRQVSSTKRLASLMKVHNCDNLVSCLVYFAEQPNGVVHVTIRGLPLKRSIPISCSVCNQQFTTVSDIEQHGADHGLPKLKCHLCPRFFFSDLLYREHLLTHLGDNQYSMIPVIGSSTLTPPSWMHNDVARMGCEMDRVLGPYCELSVPNRVNEEVSSDEDVINTRDTVKKKRLEKKALDGDKNKRKKMNANFAKKKKSGEGDRCIHCRQLERIDDTGVDSSIAAGNIDRAQRNAIIRFKSGCKPTDLCTCVSWLDRSSQLALQMPQVSFGDNNSFINSLTQKFTPIGHLYVGSCFAPIHDTIKGAIITDCVYMCMTCHMLRLGKKSALMHIRVCLQKNLVHRDPQKTIDFNDENIVMRLTYAQSTPNTRVSCPKCANTCCSIVSLRRHLALDHGIFAPFSPPEANKDIGIIEWTGAVRKVATLTEVTNVKLNLTRDGDFKMPSPQRYRTLYSSGPIIQQSSSSSVCAGSSSRIVEVDERTGEIRNGINVVTNIQPQDQTTVRCEICGVNQPSILEFANHLVANHLFYCEMCGEAFSEKTPLNLHKATCPPWAHKTNDGEHLPFCPFCHFIFSTPGRYYKHIAHMHLEHVKLDRETHKVHSIRLFVKIHEFHKPLEESITS